MCWGKGIWFYCHSDHCYHYPAHSYYLWENGGRVVRMLTWHLESWKKSIWVLEKSWKKSLKFVSEKGYGPSRSWARQSLSLSLSPLSEWYWVQVSQQQNLMKCWRRGGGGNLWWTNILSRRVGRSNSFSCFMLQKLGETLAAMWANAVCIVISQVYDYWKSNFVPKGGFFYFLFQAPVKNVNLQLVPLH